MITTDSQQASARMWKDDRISTAPKMCIFVGYWSR